MPVTFQSCAPNDFRVPLSLDTADKREHIYSQRMVVAVAILQFCKVGGSSIENDQDLRATTSFLIPLAHAKH
jgi:hypothetical protein